MFQELLNVETGVKTVNVDENQPNVGDETPSVPVVETAVITKPEGAPKTPEPSPPADPTPFKAPETVPLPVYMEVKHELRDLRQELQSIRSQQKPVDLPVVSSPAQTVVDDPDPLVLYQEEYVRRYTADQGEAPKRDEIPVPAGIIIARDGWKQRQVQAQQQASVQTSRATEVNQYRTMYPDSRLGPGLGFDSVVSQGYYFLTEGDKVDLNSSPNYAETLYDKCFDRLVRSGTPQGQYLAQKLAEKNAMKPAPAVPTTPKTPTSAAPTPEATIKPEVPRIENILQRHPTIAAIGLDYPYGES